MDFGVQIGERHCQGIRVAYMSRVSEMVFVNVS